MQLSSCSIQPVSFLHLALPVRHEQCPANQKPGRCLCVSYLLLLLSQGWPCVPCVSRIQASLLENKSHWSRAPSLPKPTTSKGKHPLPPQLSWPELPRSLIACKEWEFLLIVVLLRFCKWVRLEIVCHTLMPS